MFSWNWIRPTGHRSNMRRVWSKLALAATKCRAIFPCLFGVNPISSALILLFLHQNDFRGSCWSNLFLMIFPVDKEMPVFDSGFWKNPEFVAWHPYLFRLNIYCMYSIFMATPKKVETSYPTKMMINSVSILMEVTITTIVLLISAWYHIRSISPIPTIMSYFFITHSLPTYCWLSPHCGWC